MVSSAKKKCCRRDRLSDLPDDMLGHVISFLPTEEAGRAAVLSRRWRRAFGLVQTISFQPLEILLIDVEAEHMRLVDGVNRALFARRICAGDAPLRCLRVAMRRYTAPDSYDVDQWLSYALGHGIEELRLGTSRHIYAGAVEQCCLSGGTNDGSFHDDAKDDFYDSDDESSDNDYYDDSDSDDYDSDSDSGSDSHAVVGAASATPTYYDSTGVPLDARLIRHHYDVTPELFSCATMRALHLASCSLPPSLLPSTIHLPSLETLSLTNITYTSLGADRLPQQISGENIQRVISYSPRLADLTLEGCDQITDIAVHRLASFALRCCHGVRRVALGASETLRAFEYRGGPPAASCFRLGGGAPSVAAVKINVCGANRTQSIDLDRLRELLILFAEAAHLQLNVIRNARFDHDGFHASHFPLFHNLTRLELGSRGTDPRVVHRVAGVLRKTPNLTALVIKLRGHNRRRDLKCRLLDVKDTSVPPCLRERLREMSVEQYEGLKVQKMLLKWLLRNALVVESVRVVKGGRDSTMPARLVNEIKRWARNPATRMTFS